MYVRTLLSKMRFPPRSWARLHALLCDFRQACASQAAFWRHFQACCTMQGASRITEPQSTFDHAFTEADPRGDRHAYAMASVSVPSEEQDGFTAVTPAPAQPTKKPDFREGDWVCPACRNHNFQRRHTCNDCGFARVMSPTETKTVPGARKPYAKVEVAVRSSLHTAAYYNHGMQREDYQFFAARSFCRECWEANPRQYSQVPTVDLLAAAQLQRKDSFDDILETSRICPAGHSYQDPVTAVLWPTRKKDSPTRQNWIAARLPPVC